MDKKALSLPILVSLVVGNMIGTGIYVLPASLAEFGTISLLAWIFTSIGALFLALTFAHLNHRFPVTGGPYAYCKEAFGKLGGFITAYVYWMSNMVSIAGIAVSSVGYIGFISPRLNSSSAGFNSYTALAFELGFIWLFTLINIIGIHAAGVVQIVLTIIKILPLIIVTIVGLSSVHLDNFAHFGALQGSNFTALSSAAALTFWAFIGLEAATVPAENTKGPSDIYKATLFGTLLTSIIYISSTFVLMGMIPIAELKNSQFPFAEAGTMLFGSHAALIIALCAIISGLGTLNVSILVQGQIVFAAARDQLFPRRFARLSKHDAPVAGQLLSSTIVSFFVFMTIDPSLLNQFSKIAQLAALLTLVTYFATTLAELKFLIQGKIRLHQLLLGRSLFITLLAAAYSIWMISSFNYKIIIYGAVIILLCVPLYYFTVRKYN